MAAAEPKRDVSALTFFHSSPIVLARGAWQPAHAAASRRARARTHPESAAEPGPIRACSPLPPAARRPPPTRARSRGLRTPGRPSPPLTRARPPPPFLTRAAKLRSLDGLRPPARAQVSDMYNGLTPTTMERRTAAEKEVE